MFSTASRTWAPAFRGPPLTGRRVPALAQLPDDGRDGPRPRAPHGRLAWVPEGDLDPLPDRRDDPRTDGDPPRGPPIPHGAAGLQRCLLLELWGPHGPRPRLRAPHPRPGPPRRLGRHGGGAVRDRRDPPHVNPQGQRAERLGLHRPPLRKI